MIIHTTAGPDKVLGFKISGKLTAQDYETVLMPAIDQRVKRDGTVNVLVEWDDSFSGMEAKAMFDDAKLGFAHWNHFHRLALVGAPHWFDGFAKLFDLVSKGKVKTFEADEFVDALKWARG